MTRFVALLLCVAIPLLLYALWNERGDPLLTAPEDARARNIVLISIDTLRADHVHCYGYPLVTTPAIDRLATQGVRFAHAFSPASWTLPAHMSMLTSQPPHVHGVEQQDRRLRSSTPTLATVFAAAGYDTAALVIWLYVGKRLGFVRGVRKFVEFFPDKHDVSSSIRAHTVIDAAIEWLEQERASPFFQFVHLFDPHMDYDPPPPFQEMFDPDYAGHIDGGYGTLRPFIRYVNRSPATLPARDLKHVLALYDGEIRFVDAQVERILAALDSLGLEGRTLVVVTSDHGEEFGEHGSMEGHQWTLYDEVTHVPLILKIPGGPAGLTIENLVSTMDIAPTLIDLADLRSPATFAGRSLVDAIEGRPITSRQAVFSATKRFNPKWAIRTETQKLILTLGPEVNHAGVPVQLGYELYDLTSDTGEHQNRFTEDAAAASALVEQLSAWMGIPGGARAESGESVSFDKEELEQLRALGYVE